MPLPARPLLALAGLAAVGILLAAAEPSSRDNDPQSTVEPPSGPGAGQKFLEKFVGDWEVAKTFYPRTGDPVRMKGECRQTMIHDGRFLQSDFVFGQDDKKTTGQGTLGFDAESGKFTSVWTDSRSTRMSFRQSEDKFNGEEIVLFSRSLNVDEKDARRSRTVTGLEEEGKKLVHRQYVPGPDGKERLLMELLMTRKAEKSPPGK